MSGGPGWVMNNGSPMFVPTCRSRFPKTGLDNETAAGYRLCILEPGHSGLCTDDFVFWTND